MNVKPWMFVLLCAILLLSACSGNPPQPAQTENSSAAATVPPVVDGPTEPAPASATAALPLDPLRVDVALDESAAVEQLVPLEGGTLHLETADGAKYTLEIPADALIEPVQVRMTPVKQVQGLPFGAPKSYAVHLEPEGLFFYHYAALTIEPPAEIPADQQLLFGYQQSGQEVFLAQPDVKSKAIKLLLPHFSGYGVTQGFLSDVEPVRARLGGSDETRLQSQVAEILQRERQRQLLGGGENDPALIGELDPLVSEFYNLVVAPRIAAAGESCAAGRLAVQTAIAFERQRQLLGIGSDLPEIDLGQILAAASRACLKEEYAMCAEQHIIHRMIPIWFSIERQEQLIGSSTEEEPSTVVEEARKLTEQCLTFELEFESSGKTMDQSLGFEGSVSANVPLRFDASAVEIKGTGTLKNLSSNFYAEGCTVDFTVSDGTFQVFSLVYKVEPENFTIIPEPGKPVDPGKVVSLDMNYHPGATSGSLSVVCDGQQMAFGPGTAWFGTFMMTHIDEQNVTGNGAGYTAADWTIHGGELFAERSWQREDASIATTEQGTMKLYHRPGK